MSKDELALSALPAGPPQEAEYDAVYAAVTATERGRWFLSEFADRTRQTDTQVVLAALARIEASICGEATPRSSSALWRDLAGIAAAVKQARAAIAAETTSTADVTTAVERIQDVSFSLRERAVDASLCDAIDAALRDVADACRPHKANGKSTRFAAELLDDIAGRLDDLIKQSLGGEVSAAPPPQAAGQILEAPLPADVVLQAGPDEQARPSDDDVSQLDQFIMELNEGHKPPAVVASLARSLTSAASAIHPGSEFGGGVEPLPAGEAQSQSPAPVYTNGGARWHIEGPDFVFHSPAQDTAADAAEEPPVSSEEIGRTHALLTEPQIPERDEIRRSLFDASFPVSSRGATAAAPNRKRKSGARRHRFATQ